MAPHRLEDVHGRKAGNVETGKPHVHYNRNLQGVVIRLELTLHFLFVLRSAAYLEPLFGVLIPHGHYYADLFSPFGTKLHKAVVDLHCYRSAIGNNQSFSGKNIGTILLVVINDIGAKRIDHLRGIEDCI